MTRRRRPRYHHHHHREDSWHLDKKVSLAIILSLVVQAGLGLSWANKTTYDLAELKKDVAALHIQVENQERDLRSITQLQADVASLKSSVQQISTNLTTVTRLTTQMDSVLEEIKEVRREYRQSNARLWDETRNLRGAIAATPGAPRPSPLTSDPTRIME